ncbi:MAG: cyclic nucleotide-binding domain-containing protein [Cyclobacteriaceae bacterium]|nr:cyclic nucleotide-binding domain-containing protein [Cyclobacteriaceae bacterium]
MLTINKEIRELKFFMEFDEKYQHSLFELGEIKEFAVKEIIIKETQELHDLFVILEGHATLGITVPDKGRINVGTIYPGQIISWSALFKPYISTAVVTADVPTRAMAFNAKKIQAWMEREPEFGYRLMRFISETLSQRLHDTRFQLVNIVTI